MCAIGNLYVDLSTCACGVIAVCIHLYEDLYTVNQCLIYRLVYGSPAYLSTHMCGMIAERAGETSELFIVVGRAGPKALKPGQLSPESLS